MHHSLKTKRIRLYVEQSFGEGLELVLDEGQSHYLVHVMRCQEGDRVLVFSSAQGEWEAFCHKLTKKGVIVRVAKQVRGPETWLQTLHLVCPPLRQNRFDMLLEKACELGVTQITPVVTEYTQVRHSADQRWRKILIESAEQSERLALPHMNDLKSFESVLEHHRATQTPLYVAFERHEQAMPLWKVVQSPQAHVWMVGPEGGWSPREKELFLAHPYVHPVSLGSVILRAETSALMILSVRQSWHNMYL